MTALTLKANPSFSRGVIAVAAPLSAVASNIILWAHLVAGMIAQAYGEAAAHPSPRAYVIAAAAITMVAALLGVVSTSPARRVDQVATFLGSLFMPGAAVFIALLGYGLLMAML